MATGEKKYIDAAAKLIKSCGITKIDPKQVDALLKGDIDLGYVGWHWGYSLITLGEYHLLTKDKSVLPAIRTYALGLARGQDGGGLWGHRMATVKRGGRLPGYAQMNQSSMSCFMGMLFAKKCGINDPVLDAAIKKTYTYVEYHVGRGAFPYGVHGPQTREYNNNGSSASAGLCMALENNQKGALFFAKLSSTSYDGLERGHASAFFNPLWTPLGANLAGPEVTQQFFRKSLWFHNLKRKWDGSYGNESMKEGPEAGVALLNYCLQRKALLITGRDADKSIWLNRKDATEAVMMGKMDYASMSNDELIALALDHPIPQVTRRAKWELLTKRRKELTPKWISYLSKGTDKQKALALSQFSAHIPLKERIDQLPKIGAILRDPKATLNLRVSAAQTVCHFGEPAHSYYMDIVELLAKDRPDDRVSSYIDEHLGACLPALCKSPFGAELVTDKEMFYKVALKLINHKRQLARGSGLSMLLDIPMKDFHRVGDRVMHVIKNKDSTYESHHSVQGTMGTAITILANLNIEDGLPYFVKLLSKEMPGKFGFKIRMICAILPKYGGNAKETLDQLEKMNPGHNKGRFAGMWQKMAKKIREDKNPPKLITLKEAMRVRD